MIFKNILPFVLKSVIVGLALAFVIVAVNPELLQHSSLNALQGKPTDSFSGPVSYSDAVNKAAPSVANLYIAKVQIQKKKYPLFNDPLLQHLFGNRYRVKQQKKVKTGEGSGVIIGNGGYILTNLHVVRNANRIMVAIPGRKAISAKVIGFDKDTDLAVLKADSDDLPSITIGQPDKLNVGDVALAIGNPLGVGQTVTMGIISATGRSQMGISTYENFIQTDAAINPGNSGGALVNARGELIGINTFILSKSGGSQGLGFAIPIDMALNVLDQIVNHGRVIRGWMGVAAQNMTPRLSEALNLKNEKGLIVTNVVDHGPAEEAGLQPGDLITHLNGERVLAVTDMSKMTAKLRPGTKVTLQGWRGKHRFEFPLIIREKPLQTTDR